MGPSPQWTGNAEQLPYITLIHLLHEPKDVIVQFSYRRADSLVLRRSPVGWPIDVHSLQAQRNICFTAAARAANVTAGPNQLSLPDDKRVKVLQCGHQIGAFTCLSPLLKCHFYNHASTFYSEINEAHAWVNNTGQTGDQNFGIND